MTKEERRFIRTCNAFDRVEKALLDLMPHIYASEKLMERVCRKSNWQQTVFRDGKMVLEMQYEQAGKTKGRKS